MADGDVASSQRSFLKWAGGKTRTAPTLAALAPPDGTGAYFEPFCGSAAVFFALRPQKAILADANEDLVACLRTVRDDPESVMRHLDRMPNSRPYFDEVRRQDTAGMPELERAVRLIYLNKTAFRGLWRVNKKGEFNTPYGEYDRPYYNRETMLAASNALQAADIRWADFEDVLDEAQPSDWIYLDPPYVPDRKWGDFTRYTAGQFGPHDQERLALTCRRLDQRGVKWLMTNSATGLVQELYDGYRMAVLPTRRDITLQSKDRDSIDLLIANYDLEHPDLRHDLPPLPSRRPGYRQASFAAEQIHLAEERR